MLEGRKFSWFVFVFDERQRRLMNLFVAVGVLAGVGFGCETKRFHHRIHVPSRDWRKIHISYIKDPGKPHIA